MKRSFIILSLIALAAFQVNAQTGFSINTKVWTTNYWSHFIYLPVYLVTDLLIEDPDAKDVYRCLMPNSSVAFPVGIEKKGFESNDIYGPYHRAFSNPFKHLGDYSIGVDGSYKWRYFGLFAGVHFKSQEITFDDFTDKNLRGFYFQPRAGVIIGKTIMVESGIFYDLVVDASGNLANANKDMLSSGLGLDFAISFERDYNQSIGLKFMMPLHNFLNEKYRDGIPNGMKRRVGYIMISQRFVF